ncbi:solute carrier family 22 member 2 [Plutella xylostella]|uniref:solute carrier family 22 member 2 n=1 Tax=Plutella xylostella TaxID=51655 RepID=UPI002032A62D|nr:solute carrier family 22 member 2 [Plutella xylostella]
MVNNMFDATGDMNLLRPVNYEATKGLKCVSAAGFNSTLCYSTNGTACEKWHVKLLGIFWVKRSWTIYCEECNQLLSLSLISRLGSTFGCVTFGFVADCFGRKRAVSLGLALQPPLWLLLAVTDRKTWFTLFLFLRALFGSANVYMGIVLTCEVASNAWRTRLLALVAAPRVLASVYTVALVHCLPNLETFSAVAFVYSVLLVIAIRWTPESPHWLLFNRKIETAEKIIHGAAKKNSVSLCSEFKIRPADHCAYEHLDTPMSCVAILRTHNIRLILMILMLIWLLFEALWSVTYLTVYKAPHISGPVLCSIFFTSIAIGCLSVYVAQSLRLRHKLVLCIAAAGTYTAGLILLDDNDDLSRVIVATLAMSSGVLARLLILVITPRLFAISVRATMVGLCNGIAHIGAIVTYLVVVLRVMNNYVLLGVIFACTLSLGALCMKLPDVDDRELPDVLEDMDYFMDLSKPLRWASQKTRSTSREEVELRVHSFSTDRDSGAPSATTRVPARPISWLCSWVDRMNCFRRKFY